MKMVEDGQNEPKITPKLRRSQEVGEVEEVDRVSELPDCLLIEILSRLPSTKESIRTGTLSKRWKHLWTLVPTLVFTQLDYLSWSSQSFDFYSFVDKALTQRPQSKLKKLEVDANYHTEFESQVKNWIRYAIRCNVEELILKLDLWGTGSFCQLDQFFYISSCFTDLTLDGCILNPTGAISWKNLRSLCITGGKLDEAVIENILSGCPLLETLVLEDCFGYKRLDITSKSVKNLVFSGYRNPYLEWEFAVSAPNISSLTIQDELCLWKLLLLNVNSLIEAKLDYWYDDCMYEEEEEELLKGFIVNLRHVKELKIGVTCSKVLSRLVAKGFHLPSNIKFLDGESESESESESDEDS